MSIGTERQVNTALTVLRKLSEESEGNGRLRDAIAQVREALWDVQDAR